MPRQLLTVQEPIEQHKVLAHCSIGYVCGLRMHMSAQSCWWSIQLTAVAHTLYLHTATDDDDEAGAPSPAKAPAAAGGEPEDVRGPHTNLAVRLSKRDPNKKWLLGERLSYVLLTGSTVV
jgi:hypothetical protein